MSEIDERLAAFSALFAAHADTTADTIRNAANENDADDLRRLCHSLAGRAGMFGQMAIGDAALSIERALDAGRTPDSLVLDVDNLVARLESLAADNPQPRE